ncbi:MAG TPA: phage portal protein [Candidatus Fimicola cottocaccae]|nr:phage portal protein [Candidatus Fimicola cottocaccae]
MFVSDMDLIKAKLFAEGRLNDGEILREIINDDENSVYKHKMYEGEKYYRCEQDILNHNFNEHPFSETRINDEGFENEGIVNFKNPNRSNNKCVNPFHRILVDQKASYIAGREPTITVREGLKSAEFEKKLSMFTDDYFNQTVYDLVVGASNKGLEYIHIYYDSEGELKYCIVPAEEIIAVFDNDNENDIKEVIRYYYIRVFDKGYERLVRKAEWWTGENVSYYIEDNSGVFIPEQGESLNVPHWYRFENNKKYGESWGRVPFVVMRNNSRSTTDLELIKSLSDAYDLVLSEGTNNLIDLVELYWVIEGYEGETASAIAKKLQINKAVHISDSSGKVEAKQVDIPVQGRIDWLKLIKRDIFQFGMGVDTDTEKLGSAPSGVSLKFQYSMFNLKVNGVIPRLKKALKDFLWFVANDYFDGEFFDMNIVDININLNSITDDKETMEILAMSKGIVSEKTLLGKHPFVDDVNSEIFNIDEERRNSFEYDRGTNDKNN